MTLAVISTHPIQYQAPVYRALQTQFGIPTTAIYGSDFSIIGYQDREFGAQFAWDTDLTSGYTSLFLSRVAEGGAMSSGEVSAAGMLAQLRQIRPDAILLSGYRFRFDLRAFWAARQIRVPLLFRAEATDHSQKRSWAKALVRDAGLRWFYRQFDAILYIGQRALMHYRRLGVPEDQLIFSPYCVDTQPFRLRESDRDDLRNLTRNRLNITADQIVLLMSGKLSLRKGPDYLIRAVKLLAGDLRQHITVVFLGDGEMRNALKELSETEPTVKTHFIGFQNQSQLSAYYHAADLLVMPSLFSETWGLVVNEALHHGLPCLVSDQVGCAPDLVEPGLTGDVFSAGSAEALAEAIQRGMALTGRPDIQDACRDKVSAYTIERAAAGVAAAYTRVVSAPSTMVG
jgi:glycosyltransferase involved in cell wall biosynthesis